MTTPLFVDMLLGLVILYPAWRIFVRAGFSPWWSLLVVVPVVGLLAALLVLGLRRWPAEGGTA